MRAGCDFLPALAVFLAESQLLVGLQQHVRIKDPHDHLFAKGGRHGGQTQLHLTVVGLAGLDAPVLGAAFLSHIQAAEDLEATGHRHAHMLGELINVVQNAVDPEPDLGDRAAGLYVNIRGALVEGVLEQPIDNLDDVLVIGVRMFAGAKIEQLLEILVAGNTRALAAAGLADGIGELVELHGVPADILGIGDNAPDILANGLLKVLHPIALERFCAGDQHLIGADLNGQDAMALRKGVRHHPGNGGCVDLEGINMVIGLPRPVGQPVSQPIQIQGTTALLAGQRGNRHQFQRVAPAFLSVAGCRAQVGRQHPLCVFLADFPAGNKRGANISQGQGTSGRRGWPLHRSGVACVSHRGSVPGLQGVFPSATGRFTFR